MGRSSLPRGVPGVHAEGEDAEAPWRGHRRPAHHRPCGSGTRVWEHCSVGRAGVESPDHRDGRLTVARCDVRGLTLDVPAGGATFEVTVTPSNPSADFDLTVSGPDGEVVGTSAGAPIVDSPTSTEKVVVAVTEPGLYRIEVNPYLAVNTTFKGEAKLR